MLTDNDIEGYVGYLVDTTHTDDPLYPGIIAERSTEYFAVRISEDDAFEVWDSIYGYGD